jgi:Na+-transporting NADH:ubiquinone oxidoreductase subunit F
MPTPATQIDNGRIKVTINGSKDVMVEGGKSLLAALKEQGIFIRSACGGRGACGLCKVTIEDAGAPLSAELKRLKGDEHASGVRLACQTKVTKPLRIVIPEDRLGVRRYRSELVSLRDLTHDIKELRLKLIEPAEIAFTAGQFVQIEVPPRQLTGVPAYRAYSISSDPQNAREIELEIRYVPNGICTTYVHRHLKPGDPVVFNGPHGEFHLRNSQREILFIAGGSGMAPIKSILLEMARTRNPRKTTYFFGAAALRDLFLIEEMRALEGVLPAFHFVPALSAPLPDDRWHGERGLITEVVGRHIPNAADMEAYLCGSPLMINACIAVLKEKGMPGTQIFFDKFA